MVHVEIEYCSVVKKLNKKFSGKEMDLICIILSKVTQAQQRIKCSSSCTDPSL